MVDAVTPNARVYAGINFRTNVHTILSWKLRKMDIKSFYLICFSKTLFKVQTQTCDMQNEKRMERECIWKKRTTFIERKEVMSYQLNQVKLLAPFQTTLQYTPPDPDINIRLKFRVMELVLCARSHHASRNWIYPRNCCQLNFRWTDKRLPTSPHRLSI